MADEVKPMLPELFASPPKDLPRVVTEFMPIDLVIASGDDEDKED